MDGRDIIGSLTGHALPISPVHIVHSVHSFSVTSQPNAVSDSKRHGILDPEGVVHRAQAEGLGNGISPRPPALKGRFIGLAMRRPYRSRRLFYRHGHKPSPSTWAIWTGPSARKNSLASWFTAFGWVVTFYWESWPSLDFVSILRI